MSAFIEWLRSRPRTDDVEGDFTADALRDPKWPIERPDFPESLDALLLYVMTRGADQDVCAAARRVWFEYAAERGY